MPPDDLMMICLTLQPLVLILIFDGKRATPTRAYAFKAG